MVVIKRPEQPRILVLGGTTHRNRGDLAMQAGLADWLHATCPGAAVDFLSRNPELTGRHVRATAHLPSPDALLATEWTRETPDSTKQRKSAIRRGRRFVRRRAHAFGGASESKRAAMSTFFEKLDACSAVVVPGSGSMNSLWWHDWLYPKVFTVLAAARAGKPIFMSSQGIGPPFGHPLDAALAGEMFSACQLLGVRDGDASIEILDSIGVRGDKIITTGDDALLFQSPEPDAAIAAELAAVPAGRLRVGVNLRDSSGYGRKYPKMDPAAIAASLDLAAANHNLHYVFLPISYDEHDDDRTAAAAIVAEMADPHRTTVVRREWDAAQIRALAGAMDLAVGVSYHFCLFSLHAGVPTLGVFQNPYYQQKSLGLFGLYGCPEQTLELPGADGAPLTEAIERLVAGAQAGARQLADRTTALNGVFGSAHERLAGELRQAVEGD